MGRTKENEVNKKEKFFGIDMQITRQIVILLLATCIILAVVATVACYLSSVNALEQTINETSSVAAQRVSAELKEYKAIAYETGSIARLADESRALADKRAILEQRMEDHNFTNGTIINADGWDIMADMDLSDREYFRQAMQGNTYVSTPSISRLTGELTMMITAPLWENGLPHTKVIGAIVYTPYAEFLNEMIADIDIGKKGMAFIVDADGNTIAHSQREKAGNENLIKTGKADIAGIVKDMTTLKDGLGTYSEGGTTWMVSYSPIADTDGWSIGIIVQRAEFLNTFYIAIAVMLVIAALCLVMGVIYGRKAGKRIAQPIIEASDRLKLLAEGDMHSVVPTVTRNDETKVMADSLQMTVTHLKGVIQDIQTQLGAMAEGNFKIEVEKDYIGDLKAISSAVKKIVASLQSAFKNIDFNTARVAEGAQNLATASQALADGATDQASSIEELTATMTEIADKININAEHAEAANNTVDLMNDKLEESNREMKDMVGSMDKIKDASGQIADIIKTIEDIASQTNLLALNASIEAARAGDAGRGFAVVAEEVGHLADQSVEAAKSTAQMIGNAIAAVEEGTRIADMTAKSLTAVVENANDVKDTISKIAEASQQQAESARQITDAINQISAVVEENSATAEESAATSEELSSESTMLKTEVEKFKY